MALLQLVRVERFRRRVAAGAAAPAWLGDEVRELAARLGVRPPSVRVLADLASPVVWGLGRPRLLWPAALLARLPAGSRRAATVHELAHLRRRDHWVGWLQLVGSCVWWWNPLFWHVRRQLGRAAELACDAWVVETLPRARRAYAEALLGVCELSSRRAIPVPAVGMGGAREELERRLTMIMREKVPCRLPVRGLVGVGLLALIALPSWSPGQRGPETVAPRQETPEVGRTVAQGQGPTTAAQPADREQRLQRLEASLEALLKEVKELRGEANKPAKTTKAGQYTTGQPAYGATTAPHTTGQPAYGATTAPHTTGQPAYKTTNIYQVEPLHAENVWYSARGANSDQPMHLTRAAYKLPKDKADALATFLRDQVKTPVLETKVEGDGLVVTTTPEAQQVIGQFIALVQGKPAQQHNYNYSVPQKR
jgi:hypothetical protein